MKRTQLTETKAQRWRALAILDDGTEALLCLGSSIVQVRDNYRDPWYDLLAEQVRKETDEIALQKWSGAPDQGSWETQANLPLPPVRRPAVAV